MSLNVPLSVMLVTDRGAFRITKQARDLRFRSVSPGGFASCTVPLDRPLKIQPDDVQYYGRLVVTDTHTGQVVSDTQLEDPARSAGPDGTVHELVGIGPSGHAHDRTIPLVLVDKQGPSWTRLAATLQELDTDNNRPDDTAAPGWRLQVRQGSSIDTTRGANMGGIEYRPITVAGQNLGRVSLSYDMGVTDANWRLRLVTSPDIGSTTTVDDIAWTTTAGSLSRVVGTDWSTSLTRRAFLRISRLNTTATVSADTAYAMLTGLVVQATRYDAAGNELLTGASYPSDTILASDIVKDAVGRLCPLYDGANATIVTTSQPIDQFAYPGGIDAFGMFAEAMRVEAGTTWHAWERNPATGKYRFEYVNWPTAVRYDADVRDGYDSQGSADSLYDRVRVFYRDSTGATVSVVRTQTIPELTKAGRPREAPIDLGGEFGSLAQAQKAGDDFLAEHRYPLNAGRLRIARPILDRLSGRYVAPWEIRPGNLIRVRGIQPRPDALNATGRDGVSVFRIISTEFSARDAAVVCELDSYAQTVARLLANPPRFIGRPVARPTLPLR